MSQYAALIERMRREADNHSLYGLGQGPVDALLKEAADALSLIEAERNKHWRTLDGIPMDGTSFDLLLSSGREVSCAYWGETIGGAEEGWFVGDTFARGEDEEVIRWRPYRSPLSARRLHPTDNDRGDGN